MEKLCADCKFYTYSKSMMAIPGTRVCYNQKAIDYGVVSPQAQRMFDDVDHCGPEGKWWEKNDIV